MFNPLFIEETFGDAPRDRQAGLTELTTGDWIALRRCAAAQSLTDGQVERLLVLGLAEQSNRGLVCSEHGRRTLQTRP